MQQNQLNTGARAKNHNVLTTNVITINGNFGVISKTSHNIEKRLSLQNDF